MLKRLHHQEDTQTDTAVRGSSWKSRRRANLHGDALLQSYLKGEAGLRRNRVMQSPSPHETRRLTCKLRAYAGVSPGLSRERVLVDERLVRRKQKIQRASSGSSEKKWPELKAEIAGRCAGQDLPKVSCWGASNRITSPSYLRFRPN